MVIRNLFLNLILLGFPSFLIKQLDLSISTGCNQISIVNREYNYLEMALLAIPLRPEVFDGLKALKSLQDEHEAECDCEESNCHKCHKGHRGHRKNK